MTCRTCNDTGYVKRAAGPDACPVCTKMAEAEWQVETLEHQRIARRKELEMWVSSMQTLEAAE